jgi:hypothetical protein
MGIHAAEQNSVAAATDILNVTGGSVDEHKVVVTALRNQHRAGALIRFGYHCELELHSIQVSQNAEDYIAPEHFRAIWGNLGVLLGIRPIETGG